MAPRHESGNDGNRRRALGLAAAALAALAVGAGTALWTGRLEAPKSGYPGLGGDFTLTSDAGPVSLSDFRGKAVLLYFGYTFCPDVCPTTLATLHAAMQELPAELRDRVQVIMISVDPERDTPKRTAEYARYFDPSFLGVTGSPQQIAAVLKQYRAIAVKVPNEKDPEHYAVDHSAQTYLIGPDGGVVGLIPYGAAPARYVEALTSLLDG